jgi:Ca2+-transporting ATPase
VTTVDPPATKDWYSLTTDATVAALDTDPDRGLSAAEAADRLARYGPNELTSEPPPSVWKIVVEQLRVPMNLTLLAVVVVSFAIDEVSTAIIVALLVVLNLVLATRQEVKARESVDALSNLQVPQAKVVRDGALGLVPAVDLVPGDLVQVADALEHDAEVMSNTALEQQLQGQPKAVREEIIDINTDAPPRALQVALLIPLIAGLLGFVTSFRMARLPDPEPTDSAAAAFG